MNALQTPRPARQPFLNAPAVVLWLIGIILLAHVGRALLPAVQSDQLLEDYALIPARYALAMTSGWSFSDVLPLVTYIFLHGDYTHVGINSVWLLAFGPVVAHRLGAPAFLLFFFFCGIAAALTHVAVYWGSPGAVIGASGSVSGLMGAAMRIVYGRLYGYGETRPGLAPVFSKQLLAFSAVWTVVNIGSGILRLGVNDDITLVAWVAHLGGYFTGLLTIGFFDRLSPGARNLQPG